VSIRKNIESKQTAPEALLHERHVKAYEVTLERIKAGDKIIEIGHGDGYGLNMIAQKADIVGLDVDASIVDYAKKKYGEQYFQHYDGEHIPYEDKTFDAACMFQVIEHVPDDVLVLKEIRRVLKDGAFVILTTPNRVMRVPYGEKPWNEEHLREYYPEELEAVMKQAGFKNARVLGIDASDDYREMELKRVTRARKLRKLDPLGFRRLLPDQALYNVGRMVVHTGEAASADLPSGEFYVSETEVYRSLDLLGIGVR
jgi:SAM-dependent methyltransferase